MKFRTFSMHCILSFSRMFFPLFCIHCPEEGYSGECLYFSFDALTWGTRISTLGSDVSGGSVYILNLVEPLDFNRTIPVIRRRIHEVASFDCSIWTADCQSSGGRAVIGTILLFSGFLFITLNSLTMYHVLIFESSPVLASHILGHGTLLPVIFVCLFLDFL